jgi:tetratricopeptide (TPR) repeat protein
MSEKSLSFLTNILFNFFLVFLFFLPIFYSPLLADKFDLPKILLIYFFCSILLIIFAFFYNFFVFPDKVLLKILGFYILVYSLSTSLSYQKATSLLGYWGTYTHSFLFFIALLIIFFVTFFIFSKKRGFFAIAVYLTTSAFLTALYGIYQYFGFFLKGQADYRLRSTIGEPNRLAFYLIAVLPISFSLFLKENNKFFKILFLIINLVISLAIILTSSRAAWISLLISLLIFFYFINKKKVLNYSLIINRNWFFLGIFFLGFFSFSVWQKNIIIYRIKSIYKDLINKNGSTYFRLDEWQTALKISLNRKKIYQYALGNGPQTAVYFFLKEKKPNPSIPVNQRYWLTTQVRNQYLDQYLNLGFLGLFSSLILNFYIIKKIVNSFQKDFIYWGLFFSWLVIVISGIFYYFSIINSVLFWVLSAVLLSTRETLIKYSFKNKFYLKWLLIIIGLIGIFASARVMLADFYCQQRNFQKAVKFNYLNSYYWTLLSLDLSQQAFKNSNFLLLNQAVIAGKKAVSLNQFEPKNLQGLQKAYYYQGLLIDKKYYLQALFIINKWQNKDPYNYLVYDSLGLIQLDLGQLPAAFQNFQKALKLNPEFLPGYLHCAEVLKQQGNIDLAISFYQQALEKNPNWKTAMEELKKIVDN